MSAADKLREAGERLRNLSTELDRLQYSVDEKRIRIGQELLAARKVFEASAQNMPWSDWCDEYSGRSYRDCCRCMAYAEAPDPMAALLADRENGRARKANGTGPVSKTENSFFRPTGVFRNQGDREDAAAAVNEGVPLPGKSARARFVRAIISQADRFDNVVVGENFGVTNRALALAVFAAEIRGHDIISLMVEMQEFVQALEKIGFDSDAVFAAIGKGHSREALKVTTARLLAGDGIALRRATTIVRRGKQFVMEFEVRLLDERDLPDFDLAALSVAERAVFDRQYDAFLAAEALL